MADDSISMVSTTTQIALQPPKGGSRATSRKSATRQQQSINEQDMLQSNVEMSKQLISVLTKQNKMLEQEIGRLKEICRENSTCNVIVFGPPNELTVASVTNHSSEGTELFSRVSDMFQRNSAKLAKKNISFAVLEDVPFNRMYETPFGTNNP
jgi:flagellar motor protein MotB